MKRRSFTHKGNRYWVRGKDDRDIAAKIALKKRDIDEGKNIIIKTMLVKDWQEEYLEKYKRKTLSPNGFKVLESIGRKWIDPYIGDMPLTKLKPVDCQNILNSMGDTGLSGKYLKRAKYHMAEMFSKAQQNSLVLLNPGIGLEVPLANDGVGRALTEEERALFLAACEINPSGLWALTMFYMGLRPGEVSRILVRHIDIENATLHVDGTKTISSVREVPIPDAILSKIEAVIQDQDPEMYLFTNRDGDVITKSSWRHRWSGIVKDMHILAGGETDMGELRRIVLPCLIVDDLVPYCLRHDFASRALAANVPYNTLMHWMGHTSIDMITRVYGHMTDGSFEQGRELINNYDKTMLADK